MSSDRVSLIIATVLAVLVFTAAPALIAFARRHPERVLIAKLCPGALFSFILWGALMVWAVSDTRNDAVISKYVARLRERNLLPVIVGALIVLGIAITAVTMLR